MRYASRSFLSIVAGGKRCNNQSGVSLRPHPPHVPATVPAKRGISCPQTAADSPPALFVVALVYHAESLWRKSPKALCIFYFGTFRAATKFSLIFSLMASKLNHTIRHQLTTRFPAKPLLPTLPGISQHDAKSPCDNSSPASRTSKRHPFGCLFSCPSPAKRRRFRVSFQAVEKAAGFSRQPEIMPLFSCRFAARKYSLRSTHALQSKA